MTDKTITLFKGGTAEITLRPSQIEIPDLWHIAMALKTEKGYGPQACDAILKTWHLAHGLRKALIEEGK
jgi:hypothetical protein